MPAFASTIAFTLAMLTAIALPASAAFADEGATGQQAEAAAVVSPAGNETATAPSVSNGASQDAAQSNGSASNAKSSTKNNSAAGAADTASISDAGASAEGRPTADASDTTKPSNSKTTANSKTAKAAKRAKAPKVGAKTRSVADGAYSILNKANRSYSLSASSKKSGADASFKRFTASGYQTFELKYNADRKAYTIFVSGSKKYLYATGKSSRVKQGKTANSASAFWKIRKASGGYALLNAKTERLMRGSSTKPGNGKKIIVGASKGACSRWDLYAVNSCKNVSSSTRLNRIVDHLIRTKTGSHDSGATKFRKMFNYMASNTFKYAHVNNQARPTYRKWSEKYALNMALKHRGNCFSYSSLFGYLARGCGYQTKIISGNVALGSSRVKHSWVICKVSGPVYASKPKASKHGAWHIFDPESVHDYGIPFNMGYYGATDHGTGVYRYSYPKLTE